MEEIKLTFASNIKYLIKMRIMSAQNIAKIVDKGENVVYKWAQGKREPTFGDVIKLARFLNISVDELGTGDISKTIKK